MNIKKSNIRKLIIISNFSMVNEQNHTKFGFFYDWILFFRKIYLLSPNI